MWWSEKTRDHKLCVLDSVWSEDYGALRAGGRWLTSWWHIFQISIAQQGMLVDTFEHLRRGCLLVYTFLYTAPKHSPIPQVTVHLFFKISVNWTFYVPRNSSMEHVAPLERIDILPCAKQERLQSNIKGTCTKTGGTSDYQYLPSLQWPVKGITLSSGTQWHLCKSHSQNPEISSLNCYFLQCSRYNPLG